MFEVVTGPMHCGKTEFIVGEIVRASIASRKRNQQKAILIFTPEMDDRRGRGIYDQVQANIHRIQPSEDSFAAFREVDDFSKYWERYNPGFAGSTSDPLVLVFKTRSVCHVLEFLNVVVKNTPRNDDVPLVVVDEAQFYQDTPEEVEACYKLWRLSYKGLFRILVGGLNADFANRPFAITSILISLARENAKCLSAVCDVCGESASFTQRLINGYPAPENSDRYVVGDAGSMGADKYEYQARCGNCWKLGPATVRKQNKQ